MASPSKAKVASAKSKHPSSSKSSAKAAVKTPAKSAAKAPAKAASKKPAAPAKMGAKGKPAPAAKNKAVAVKAKDSKKDQAAKALEAAAAKSAKSTEVESKKKTKRHDAANEALEAAMAEADAAPTGEEEEFDPAAFFAGSGQTGEFRPHVMRKERVDLAISVRYRFTRGPLVFNAELINLSKGGLCLRTPEKIKAATELRIEIPLPHTSELFAVMAEVVWSDPVEDANSGEKRTHTGLRFKPMSLAKQTVINQFIQQRRDEVIMAKIGLDKFTDSVPVAGLD